MKMKETKGIGSLCYPIISFTCLMIFQIYMNHGMMVPHSIPDECGAMAFAAKMAGNDWSYIFEKNGLHYGSGTTLPFFFIFYLIKDPIILYRVMLAVGCLWRTLPVFVIFTIARDYLGIKDDRVIALMSVAAILGTPTRGSAIDNEPMLIFTVWLSAYLILKIIDRKNKKTMIMDAVLLVIVLAYSFIAHERAVVYVVAALITLAIAFVNPAKVTKRNVIIAITACLAFVCLLVAVSFTISQASPSDTGDAAKNTLAAYFLSIPERMSALLSVDGLLNFIILICSNMYAVFVYYGGMIGLFLFIVPIMMKQKNSERTSEETAVLKMSVFPLAAFVLFLVGLGILWNGGPRATLDTGAEISRGYFYLRYIGSTFGICLFLVVGFVIKHGMKRRYFWLALIMGLISFRLTYNVSLKKAFENKHYSGDLFSFFGPLSFSGSRVYANGKTAVYYILPVMVASAILIVIYVLSKSRRKIFIPLILSVVMVYQYSYLVLMRDVPDSKEYFRYADSLYELKKEYPECFEDVNTIYYYSVHEGLEPNSQVILLNYSLIPEEPDLSSENIVILTNSIEFVLENTTINTGKFGVYRLDDNETIFTNCDALKQCLSDYIKERRDVF